MTLMMMMAEADLVYLISANNCMNMVLCCFAYSFYTAVSTLWCMYSYIVVRCSDVKVSCTPFFSHRAKVG